MADISIPGVTDKYKTNDLIKNLMEAERVPLKREQDRLESYKTEQTAWRNVNGYMSTLRESVRSLYSFDNPFSTKLASSTDEGAVTAEPKRDASLQSFKIEVLETAKADRFLSAELDEKTQVPAGTYEYTVNEKTISFNWKGGKLSDFAAALNRRSANTVKASLIGVTKNTRTLLIESLVTGSENRLIFSKAAKDFALQTGMIGKAPAAAKESFTVKRDTIQNSGNLNSKTVQFAQDELSLPPRSGFEAPISQKVASEKGNIIRFNVRTVDIPAQEILPDKPELPSPGTVRFKDIMLSNEELDTKLPESGEAVIKEPVEDNTVIFIKNANGTEIPLAPLKGNGEENSFTLKMSDYPDIRSLVVKNNNTHKKIVMSIPETINTAASGDYIPLNPVETASDAKIKYQGITITRAGNEIEDVVPNVKLNLHAQTEKPATITIEPDKKTAKEALITFVGKYNRLVAEINILTQTNPDIVTELEYFTEEEAKAAEERLGMFQTESALVNGKRSLQTIMTNRYPSVEDAEITMLWQAGISSSASTGGFAGITPSRLRGYLEIDEKKLDAALQSNMRDIKNLFGYDSDGDLIVDSGIAFALDKNLQAFTQTGGIIASKTSLLNTRIGSSEKNIESLEKKLTQKEQDLKRKYGQMESVLNSLEKQSDSITNFNNNQGEENKTMEIYVNSEKVDFTLEAEKTAGDIIKAFEADCAKNAAAITAVRIDGDALCEENTDSLYSRALDKIQKMEIETLCAQDIIYNLKELAVKFETLCGELEQISLFFQSGKDSKVSAIVTSFADLFDILCRVISLSALFPEHFQDFKIEDRTPLEFFKDFSPVLADFEKSLADADTVLTGDLAEYEIAPRLRSFVSAVQKLGDSLC